MQEPTITLPIQASCLHYGQACFEGMKAFGMKDGKIRIFRPFLNWKRLCLSSRFASMPEIPQSLFLDGIKRVVMANAEFVPKYEQGGDGSMYIRPLMIGSGASIAPVPSPEFKLIILVMPVGKFYEGDLVGVRALIKYGFDRAAPFGIFVIIA